MGLWILPHLEEVDWKGSHVLSREKLSGPGAEAGRGAVPGGSGLCRGGPEEAGAEGRRKPQALLLCQANRLRAKQAQDTGAPTGAWPCSFGPKKHAVPQVINEKELVGDWNPRHPSKELEIKYTFLVAQWLRIRLPVQLSLIHI